MIENKEEKMLASRGGAIGRSRLDWRYILASTAAAASQASETAVHCVGVWACGIHPPHTRARTGESKANKLCMREASKPSIGR